MTTQPDSTTEETKSAFDRLAKMVQPKVWLVYSVTITMPEYAHMAPDRAAREHERTMADLANVLGVPAAYLTRDGLAVSGTCRTVKQSDDFERLWGEKLHDRFTVVSFDCQVDPNGAVVPDTVEGE